MVTLSEIAREAGVSKSTVSKALLGGGGKTTKVSDRTVRLVRETADKLGYRPNLVAQQLAHRKNDIIGVIIDSQCCGLYNNIMAAIEKRIFLSGRRLQIGLVHDSFDTIRRYVDDLLGYNIESVICLAHYYDFAATIPPLFKPFRNVLFINPPLSREPFSFVSPDYYGNFRLAVDALLRRGHRRIVYYYGCRQEAPSHRHFSAEQRPEFFRENLRRLKLELPPDEWALLKPAAFLKTVREEFSADAVVCYDHARTLAILRAAAEQEVRIPQELSLLSLDDEYPLDQLPVPVAAISASPRKMGETAAELLLKLLDNRLPPEERCVKAAGRLMRRKSVICRN